MKYKVLFSKEQISARLPELAREIEAALPPDEPVSVLVLLNGGLWFGADLLRLLPPRFSLETLRTASYGAEKVSSGKVEWKEEWADFYGKTVLVLDDVMDAGLTLDAVYRELALKGAARVYSAVAVNKHGRRQVSMEPDFAAFNAGEEFLVGYGMDSAGRYRNLPFIGILEEDS